jgi:site-specific DNA-methyltransferase (adenine-specific)
VKPYYQDDSVTLYHGDCREVIPTLDGCDAVISDPPYAPQTHAGARTGGDGSVALIDFASVDAGLLREVFALCSPQRWCVATMDWKHIAQLEMEPPVGLRFVRFGIWVKPNGSPQFTGDRPGMGWEGVGILHRAESPMRWNGGGTHAVWRVNKENSEHPTGKPLDLVQRLVSLFSDEGETVLDPFAGGGSTLVAAKNLRRRAIGIELREDYCEITARRLCQNVLDFGGAA